MTESTFWKQTGNAENLKEELGDLLLQVVMHTQIAKEEGLFTLEDVIRGISEENDPQTFACVWKLRLFLARKKCW